MSLTDIIPTMPLAPEVAPPESYPYETADFHRCWWTYLAPRFDIPVKNRDLLIYRKSILKGLLTLREMRIAGWNSAWVQDLTPARIAEMEELGKSTDWDYLRVTLSENRTDHQAAEILAAKGYPVFQTPAKPQYVIDLNQGFDGYLQSLSHNGRKGLKKKVRRGQSLNPQLVPCTDKSDIEPFFAELLLHHITYWDAKIGDSYFNVPEERRFIIQWAKALHQSGHLVLDRLVMNGDTVNLSMGIRFGDTFYWLLTINTGLHSEYAPGLIGLYLRVEQLAAQGVTRFNMGTGDYFYKVQSANSRELCQELFVANPHSMRGRIYLAWMKRRQKTLFENSAPAE
jgi:hypothetical protein